MNFHTTSNNYKDDRYSLILQVEEGGNPHLTPYNDGKGWVTIGIGFNLADTTVRNKVFTKLGITNTSLINELTSYLEKQYDGISFPKKDSTTILNDLNGIMARHISGSTFQFANETQVKELFNGPKGNNGLVQTYENRVDKWASDKGLFAIPESKERLVLVSLSYNGVLGPSLAAAIKADNRAEAWYEIRYGSNGDKLPGLAKRHYYESDVFGLYDDSPGSVSDAEAESILQMYTRHRADILKYEATYSAQIAAANNDYHLSGATVVDTLEQMLDAARNSIISAEVTGRGITRIIDGDVLVGQDADYITSRHTWYKNDILIGTDKNDLILGGDGDDRLEGGKGDDILIGGAGVDVYVIQGHDIIIDNGQNTIIYNGEVIAGVFKNNGSGSGSTFTATDGRVLSFHSPGQLILSAEDSITFQNQTSNADFANNDFGIRLLDSPAPIRIYNGDQRARLIGSEIDLTVPPTNPSFNTYKWSATSWAANGTLSVGVAQANFNDVIVGSSDKDSINGLGGNDALDGRAGNDEIDGGKGNDLIAGGAGSDFIQGGTGNDMILSATGLNVPQRTGPGDDWQVPPGKTLWIKGSTWGVTDNANGNYTVYGGGSLTQDNAPDIIFAGDGDDRVVGGLGDDYIDGGLNNDKLVGHGGNDIIDGGDGNDYIQGDGKVSPGFFETVVEANHGNDILDGGAGADTIIGGGKHDVLFGGTGNDFLWGDDQTESELPGQLHDNDYLDGGEGDDQLIGGGKDDALIGGGGNDTLFGDDTVATLAALYHGNDYLDGGEGNDQLVGGGGDDILLGRAGIDLLYGGNGNDYLEGGDGDDLSSANGNTTGDGGLDGGAGDDTIYGGTGMDELAGGDGLDLLDGGTGNDLLFGEAGDDNLLGGEGNDYLEGGDDNDVLDGGTGIDLLFGEAGDDHLYGDDGDDELQGNCGNDILKGGAGADLLFGQNGNDTLSGGAGADYLDGGSGDDIYLNVTSLDTVSDNEGNDTVQSSVTYILGANIENLTLTGTTVINGTGNALNNVLTGNSAINTLTGGAGNDIYVIGAGDIVVEAASAGTDTVQSRITYTLGANIENLMLIGTTVINGTGNTLNNVLTGNSAVNTLTGGAGNDIYVIGTGDIVVEATNAGTDTVQSSITYTLAANVENLTLTGATAINGTGNALNNTLTGNSAANTLSGGAGADTLIGGAGDDIYTVDNTLDVVTEALSGGTDLVQSSVTYTLAANIDRLTLLGTTAINGTGNTLNNVLTGNSAINTLTGGAGNDIYVIGTGDIVVEAASAGTDTVQSSITYALAANVENLTLTGATAINGTGNALNNVLTGNSAVNTLTGGAGNDIYVIGTGDIVVEAANAGTDTVQSSITYTLAANVENLTLTGATAIDGTGNTLNNILYASKGNNILNGLSGVDAVSFQHATSAVTVSLALGTAQTTGGSGSDTLLNIENLTGSAYNDTLTGNASTNVLDGGIGADTLAGGDGSDTYTLDNIGDIVSETNATAGTGGIDLIQAYISYNLTDTDGAGINGGNVENLRLIGTSALNATGNALNNVLYANTGNNSLDGGTGTDTLSYLYGASAGITANLAITSTQVTGGSGNDTLLNIENLIGSSFNDRLTGNSGNNVLNGGLGNDILNGGSGRDSLTGGSGNDTFDFNALSELGLGATRDVITDCTQGQDTIDLSTIDSNASLAGDQAFTFVSSFTATAGQVRYSGGIVYFNTDADTTAEYEILLTGNRPTTLSATDFSL